MVGNPHEQRFLYQQILAPLEDEQANTDMLDIVARRMTDKLMEHPNYRDMVARVLRRGHQLRTDMVWKTEPSVNDAEGIKVLEIHVYDGGPAAPRD